MFDSNKLFEFACLIHSWMSHMSFQKVAAAFGIPIVLEKTHDVAGIFQCWEAQFAVFFTWDASFHGSLQQIAPGGLVLQPRIGSCIGSSSWTISYVCSFYPSAWNRLPSVPCRVGLQLDPDLDLNFSADESWLHYTGWRLVMFERIEISHKLGDWHPSEGEWTLPVRKCTWNNRVSFVVEFTDFYDRDVATIVVRGAQVTMGEGHPFLPNGWMIDQKGKTELQRPDQNLVW